MKRSVPILLAQGNYFVSLLSMLEFKAEPFVRCASILGQVSIYLRHRSPIHAQDRQLMLVAILELKRECERLGLAMAVAQVERIEAMWTREGGLLPSQLEGLIQDLVARVADELDNRKLFDVPGGRAKYYDSHGFDSAVLDSFPSARFDLEEAGKCFALGRFTAAVFHLMRVVELGLRGLGRLVPEFKAEEVRSWKRILAKLDPIVASPYNKRPDWWRGNNQFFLDVVADLHAVAEAWRNPTMHPDKKYTEEEARLVMQSAQSLMSRLSSQVSEPPTEPEPPSELSPDDASD